MRNSESRETDERSPGTANATTIATIAMTIIKPIRCQENMTISSGVAGLRFRTPVPVFLAIVVNRMP
jgi:hypothetical protein